MVPLGASPGRLVFIDGMTLEGKVVRARPFVTLDLDPPLRSLMRRDVHQAVAPPAGRPIHEVFPAPLTRNVSSAPVRVAPPPLPLFVARLLRFHRGERAASLAITFPACLVGCFVRWVTMTLGVASGPSSLTPGSVWHVIVDHLSGHPKDTVADEIVWQIRLPLVLLAAVVGAALTTAGTVVQVLVRNALADPFLLGVSSGASVGATAVPLFGAFASFGIWAISVGSVVGARRPWWPCSSSRARGASSPPLSSILCGVVLSALFESVTSFLIFRGNPQATQSVLFWLLGFGNANWTQLPIPANCPRGGHGLSLGPGALAQRPGHGSRVRRHPSGSMSTPCAGTSSSSPPSWSAWQWP